MFEFSKSKRKPGQEHHKEGRFLNVNPTCLEHSELIIGLMGAGVGEEALPNTM